MKLITNSVSPTQVTETDSAFVIEDVPFIRPMELSGGYVPESSIRQTANEWDGVPATLNHPRNSNGKPVAAATKPETHIGTVTNPRFDGESVRATIRINKAEIQRADAQAIKRQLERGESISVSSQYAAEELPPGEYDGQHRANVEQITRPDSVAILPNGPGVCDIDDGCGINPEMVANSEVTIPMQANADAEFEAGDLVRWSTQASPGTGRVAEVVTEPGEQVVSEADVENPPVREATEDEPVYKLDDWNGEEFAAGQVVKSESEILGAWDDAPEEAMQANATHPGIDLPNDVVFDNPGEAVEAAQEMGVGEGRDLAGDELIHTMEDDDGNTVFVVGPTHEETLELVNTDDGEMPEDMTDNQPDMAVTDVTTDDVDSFTDEEWDGDAATAGMPNPSEVDDAPEALDASHLLHPTGDDARDAKANWKLPFRGGPDAPVNTRALVAAIAAINGARGGVDAPESDLDAAEEKARDMLLAAPDDLFGSMDSADEDVDAGSGHTTEEGMSDNANDMGDRTAELVANHGFNPENLPPESTQCFGRIYDAVTANTDMSDNSKVGLDDLKDEAKEALLEQATERVEANREAQKKADLAEEIVANSNKYDEVEAVTEDFPTMTALKTKRSQVTDTGATPAVGSTRDSPVANTDDTEYDVGTGVLTE